MLGSWYPEFFHIEVFVGIHETKNNNQEDSKHQICFKFHPFNCKNIAYVAEQQGFRCDASALKLHLLGPEVIMSSDY